MCNSEVQNVALVCDQQCGEPLKVFDREPQTIMTMAGFLGPGEFLPVNVDKYIEMEIQTDFWEPEKIIIEI